MLKYIGDFDKLKDFEFLYREAPKSSEWYSKYYHKELEESEIIITLWEKCKGEMEICLYDTSDMVEVTETLYDLIKDGLVIKGEI